MLPYLLFTQGNQEKEDLMFSYYQKGYEQVYLQKDTAYVHLEKALTIAEELADHESSLGILDHIVLTADYHQDLPKFRKTLQQVNTLLSNRSIIQNVSDADSWNVGYLMWLASYYFETKEYVKAKEQFIKARAYFDGISITELTGSQANRLHSLYSSLGTTYRHLGNYELAELNYLRSIQLVKSSKVFQENKEAYINSSNQSLAQLYTRMGKHKEANVFYGDNLAWSKNNYERDKKYKNNLVNAYQQITLSYIAQDSLEKALVFLDESRSFLLADDPFFKDALILYGDIHSGLNNSKKALSNYKKALAVFQEFRGGVPHQDIAEVHGKIAELHLRQKKYPEGLQAILKAFKVAGNNIQINDIEQNPDPEKVFSKIQLLHLLDVKSQLLQGYYEETKEAHYQNAIRQASSAMLVTFDLLKSDFDSKLDKHYLAEKAYPMFHRLMETAHKAYDRTPSVETVQLALNIAEKNKDFVLLEALRNTQATQYGDVPARVLEKEAQLRTEITNLEKQLFHTSRTESGYSELLIKLKQEYFDFLDTLKIQYPNYHKLKYKNQSVDLATIKEKALERNGTIISYTMTDDYLYAIAVNASKQDFFKLPFNETDRKSIDTFYRLLSRPSINGAEKEITEIAGYLFEKIVQRPLADFNSENLTIIPDGELHYLPFDLLQENGSYLLEKKSIGYGNSVASLLELKEKNSGKTNKMLAFAPSFSGAVATNTDRQFGKLVYNDDEVQKIGMFYDTKMFFENEATLYNFKSNASEFNIFHLATHASANDEYPDYSYLAFTDTKDSLQGNILYVKDLYNAKLNADLVTLSACQTGIGKLQKGQGMLSLSKGFYYAGAKSIVNTLWKINDKSTVTLMDYFYEGLSRGKSKTAALRDAKLKYLETTDDDFLKHPYYWASFVVSGDAAPISEKDNWWYLGLGGLLLATLFLVIFNKKRKSGDA